MDKYNLRQVILDYPNHLKLGQDFARDISLPKKEYSKLIICGMGGSAIPADLLINYFQNHKGFSLPIYVCRGYNLPKEADSRSLIFISSYSGNTEETVSCFKESLDAKASIVAFASGGDVEKIATNKKIPLVKYEINYENFQPRFAATYAFIAMHQVLTNINLCDRISEFPIISASSLEKRGEELAKKLKGKIPIIYSSAKNKVIAKNWKIKINENSKRSAFWNYFPELNHNELVGFSNNEEDFFTIILRDSDDLDQIKKRMDITAEIYRKKGIETEIIEMNEDGYFEKLLKYLVLADWTSYYLALEYNQDPTPVDLVEDFKVRLENK